MSDHRLKGDLAVMYQAFLKWKNADAPSWLVSTPTTQTPCMSPKPRV